MPKDQTDFSLLIEAAAKNSGVFPNSIIDAEGVSRLTPDILKCVSADPDFLPSRLRQDIEEILERFVEPEDMPINYKQAAQLIDRFCV